MEQNAKKKISCGGFMLGEGLVLSEDGKTLNVSGGGGLPSGGTPYQQLVTDGNGNAKWEDKPYFKVNVISVSGNTVELDATNEEIYNAFQAGKTVTVNLYGIELKGIYVEGDAMKFYGTAPENIGSNGVEKIGVYYLVSTVDGWSFTRNTIATDAQ